MKFSKKATLGLLFSLTLIVAGADKNPLLMQIQLRQALPFQSRRKLQN